MKKLFKILLLCTLFVTIPVNASTNTYTRTESDLRIENWISVNSSNKQYILNTPSVNETEKIYDFAELLNSNEEEILYKSINSFIDKYNMDFVVVTTNDNPRYSAEQFADDFYDYNKFGKNEHRDGLLFLIDMENREFYISTTGEAIRIYSDSRIDEMLDYAESNMKLGNYYEAISSIIYKADQFASFGVPSSNKNSYIGEDGNIHYIKKINYFVSFILSGIITFITILILVNKNKMIKKATDAGNYLDKSKINITNRSDNFVTTHTTSYTISSSSGSSGGSSTHRSSSGGFHGGGGRHF